jgi:hypothetical protein
LQSTKRRWPNSVRERRDRNNARLRRDRNNAPLCRGRNNAPLCRGRNNAPLRRGRNSAPLRRGSNNVRPRRSARSMRGRRAHAGRPNRNRRRREGMLPRTRDEPRRKMATMRAPANGGTSTTDSTTIKHPSLAATQGHLHGGLFVRPDGSIRCKARSASG